MSENEERRAGNGGRSRTSALVALCALAVLPATGTAGPPVNVITLDEMRTSTCRTIDFNIATGNFFGTIRNSLLDEGNFGPGGVIDRPLVLGPPVPALNGRSLADADVVLLSSNALPLRPCEVAVLVEFVEQGGGVFAFWNGAGNAVGAAFGATPAEGGGGGVAVVVDPDSPLTNGPFGVVSGSWRMAFHQWLSDVGPNGTAVMESAGAVVASFEYGAGRAVTVGDEEWAGDLTISGCAAGQMPEADRLRLFNNALAHVIPDEGFDFVSKTGGCPGDTNCDDVVDVLDLIAVISAWGTAGSDGADVTLDGVVDVSDLVQVITAWGPCP